MRRGPAAVPHAPTSRTSGAAATAAGYYAYLWSEVLDDDAYAWFKEHGGMTRANGQRFRDMVLSRGGTEDGAPCSAPSAAATRGSSRCWSSADWRRRRMRNESALDAGLSVPPRVVAARRARRFYVGMAIAIALTVFAGFSRTYFLKAYYGTPELSTLLHIHGVVFTTWVLFLVAQTTPGRNRPDVHPPPHGRGRSGARACSCSSWGR